MRYKKAIVILGAHILRRERVEKLYQEQLANFKEEERILQSYTDDQPEIEKIALRILEMAQSGEEITRDFLSAAFEVPLENPLSYRNSTRTLGLNGKALEVTTRKIAAKENEMNALEEEPNRLVDFLEAIEDDLVSDYGLKQAGFSINMADLITKGLEELRAQEATGQEAEAAS